MPTLPRPLAAVLGRGRRARWRRGVLRRVLAAGCVGLAVAVVVGEVRPPPPPVVQVVVAAREVPAGAVLGTTDVRAVEVVQAARQPGALTATDDAVGRRVGSPLGVGEALTATRLVPRTPGEGLPVGRVALHVLVADPATADLAVPGGSVDVFPAVGGDPLARGAVVLAVDPPAAAGLTDLTTAAPARGVVLTLSTAAAEAVLSGHGGLEGVPVVNLLVRPPPRTAAVPSAGP